MFALEKVSATIAHLNTRLEKHGEEEMLAADITVTADVANSFLDKLSPGLRASFYRAEGQAPGEQVDLDAEHLAVLRYPQIETLKWEGKIEEAEVVLHGRTKAESTVLEADVAKLRMTLKEGGTVAVVFQVQLLVEPEQVAHFSGLLGKDVKVSVTPPATPDSPPVE